MRRALLSALFALALSVTRARALDVAPLSAGETAPVDLADGALSPIDVEADATRITSPFTPPSPSDPTQVVPADALTLFAALANHTVVVAFTTRACALCAQYAPEFARVAAAYAGAIDPKTDAPLVFATVDVDSGDNRRLAKTFGVTSAPFVAALRRGRWYVVSAKTGEVVVRPPRRFVGLLAAEPTARYVADAVGVEPLEPLRPHVVTLTDETIDAFVADPTKDVLVEFYAPWCGHCKRFEPFYAEVGAHFADSRRVAVARLDVDAHRDAAIRYDVQGLPSIQLFPRGYKRRGLAFTHPERRPADIIAFANSPQVWLVEARAADAPEWACVARLEEEGILERGAVSDRVGLVDLARERKEGVHSGGGGDDSFEAFEEEEEEEEDPMLRGGPARRPGARGGAVGPRRFAARNGTGEAFHAGAREMFLEASRKAQRGAWLEALEVLTCMSRTVPLRRTGVGSSPAMWNFLDNVKAAVEDPDRRGSKSGSATTAEEDREAIALEAVNRAEAEGRAINPDAEDWESFDGADGSAEEREAAGFDWEAWEAAEAKRKSREDEEPREVEVEDA